MKIKQGNVLTKITHYRLQRELGNVFIEVQEILNDNTDNRFFATPFKPPLGIYGRAEFDTYGASENEVLEQIINKIEDLKKEEIFDK